MNRKLTLLLPLALMAACSQNPAPAGTGGDDVAPAAASASTRCSPANTSRSPWTSQMADCRSATPATAWAAATPWPTAS